MLRSLSARVAGKQGLGGEKKEESGHMVRGRSVLKRACPSVAKGLGAEIEARKSQPT